MDTGKSALGLDGNLAAALGYPIGIIAIICLIMEKENRFVKFHALQSILLHVAFILVAAGVGIIGMLVWLLWLVVFLGWLIMLIMAAVKAYGGIEYKLPIVGNMAEKWTK